MNDIEEIPDSQPSIAPTIRVAHITHAADCVDCALKSDIIVHSSDGIRFAAHGQNLYSYSEAFPVSVAGPDDTDLPSASLPESSEVVSLLLQCMHLRRQPNVAKLPFVVLDELATAAEKYRVYSIMTVCAMSMASHVQQYPIDILRYATKYGYNDLANEAALFTVDFNLPTIKENFEKDSVIPYRWLEYREQWVSLLRSVQSEEPQAVILHKGGLAECPLWKPFYKDVLATVGWSSISLKGFNKTLQDKMQSKLQGIRCPYCDAVCAHKFSRTQNTQELEAHIESVHNWLAAVIRVENKTYISCGSSFLGGTYIREAYDLNNRIPTNGTRDGSKLPAKCRQTFLKPTKRGILSSFQPQKYGPHQASTGFGDSDTESAEYIHHNLFSIPSSKQFGGFDVCTGSYWATCRSTEAHTQQRDPRAISEILSSGYIPKISTSTDGYPFAIINYHHQNSSAPELLHSSSSSETFREVYEDESLTTCRTVTGLYTPPTSPVKAGPSKLRRTRSLSPGSSAKRRKTCKALSKHWVEASFCVLVEVQGIRFKLPSDRLRRLSGWFQQVLEEQKYESAGEIIYLDHTGVTAPDFEKLLDALEKSFTFDKISPPLDEIVAIMRAATALRFEDQAAWAVRRLEALWPNQLSDISPVHRSYAIEAIEAARHCGLSTILKSAFYELVRGSSLPDVLTQHVNDGSLRAEDLSTLICARDKASARWLAVAAFHGSLEKFPPCSKAGNSHAPPVLPDLAPKNNGGINLGGNTVAMRRLKFEQSGIEEIPPMRQRVPRELGIVTRCISADINHLQRVHTTLVNTSGMLQRYLFDPVMGLQALSDAPWAKEGLCSDCVQTRRAVWRAERERLWAEMDEWFEGADKE
ncbi:hypothetical protein DXG01_010851 [Tephrocybe rancida]|nr:hypothetical protein DXG01_010851 [Tephrocybe rancida]